MKAVLFNRFGGTDTLESTDTEDPQPKRGEIRVRVWARAIHPRRFCWYFRRAAVEF